MTPVSLPPASPADLSGEGFLAHICHELRTPLQTILGQGELLLRDTADEAARARLATISEHGALMLRLVNDLLDWHISGGEAFRLVPRAVDLPALVSQTVESFRPAAAAKELALECGLSAAVPQWVHIDGDRVRQVLLNLVGNAIKFTEAGRISVSLNAASDGLIELRVTDTGPGIARTEQERIFQPYARAERTVAAEGAGLGLALSARLCTRLGGGLAVASDGQRGTTFFARFSAPACPPPPAAVPGPGPIISLRGRRILVADDNALVRELFTAGLGELGARCEGVADGEQVLARAGEGGFTAVVLDLSMPRLDGVEVARRLRARFGPTLRIVGASAHAGPTERARALAAGMDAFLAKPVGIGELAAALGLPAHLQAETGEAGLRAALIAQFRTESRAHAALLESEWKKRDWPGLVRAAHYVHNSALVVRDETLSAACVDLMQAAQGGDERGARTEWERCREALAPWLDAKDEPGTKMASRRRPERFRVARRHLAQFVAAWRSARWDRLLVSVAQNGPHR